MPTRITILDEETLDQSSISGYYASRRGQLQGRTTSNEDVSSKDPTNVATRTRHSTRSFVEEVDQTTPSVLTNQTSTRVRFESSYCDSVADNHDNDNDTSYYCASNAASASNSKTAITVTPGTPPAARGLTPTERREFFKGKDIASSKGLAGYGMNCVCSLIVLTTTIMYRYSSKNTNATSQTALLEGQVFLLGRIRAVIGLTAFGFAASGFIILCHFDTWIFPKLWASIFKNGSVKERNLLILLVSYWVFTLGVSTGLYSPGQYQPNVFFGCWGCLASIFYAFDKWRDGANKTSCLSWTFDDAYETKLSLVGVALFSLVVILGGVDFILNVYVVHRGEPYNEFHESFMTTNMLVWTMACPIATLLLSVTILILRDEHFHILVSSSPPRSRNDSSNEDESLSINNITTNDKGESRRSGNPPSWWNIIEGTIHFGFFSIWTFVAFTFTNPLNSVDTMYFGIWFTFLFAMNGFGSWLKDFSFVKLCNCKKQEAEAQEM